MSWNYRVVKYANNEGYGLHEVYYDKNDKIEGWTEHPVVTCEADESFEREFVKELTAMIADIERAPCLKEEEMPK